MIAERKIFPCFFGSALKLQGVNEFLSDLAFYTEEREYPEEFGARIFKITRDENGNRLTHLKVTGGNLKVKTVITESDEKINQIRIYSGEKYETVNELQAGRICAVTGLSDTIPGQCVGASTYLPDDIARRDKCKRDTSKTSSAGRRRTRTSYHLE